MPRENEGLELQFQTRAQPDEVQMRADIAAQLGMSLNKATRWALRYAWAHATSTTNHQTCPSNSPCAGATRGIYPGRQRATAPVDQLTITHSATVEEP